MIKKRLLAESEKYGILDKRLYLAFIFLNQSFSMGLVTFLEHTVFFPERNFHTL